MLAKKSFFYFKVNHLNRVLNLRGIGTYESHSRKLQDKELAFPHGKRNKIILVARELDHMIL
jgi:hypothetical protein